MKRLTFLFIIATLVFTMALPGTVSAQIATTQTWTSSIYYYNTDPGPANGLLQVSYYDGSGQNPVGSSPQITVPPHGSGEIFIGETDIASKGSFKGSAVLSSSVPVVAVYEQSPSGTTNMARMLYSAFSITQSSQTIYIPTFVNSTSYKSQVGIQNINNLGNATVILNFRDVNGKLAAGSPITKTILPSASLIVSPTDYPTAPADGTLTVNVDTSTPTDVKLVAAVEELQSNGRRAYAFEGVSSTSKQVFMPSMLCRNGHGAQTTFYAIQNTSTVNPASVTVYAYLENTTATKLLGKKVLTIPAGGKTSLNACTIPGTLYKSGSAFLDSSENIAVVGKMTSSDGMATSFTGSAMSGADVKVAMPYVLWYANQLKGYRTYISVMNATTTPATNVVLTFHRDDGTDINYNLTQTVVNGKTVALPLGGYTKRSIDPSKAKALRADGNYRGAVEVSSDQPVIVIVRMERRVSGVVGYSYFGEDYSGIPLNQ